MPRPKKGERTPGSGRPQGKLNGDTAKLREMILNALDQAGGLEYMARQAHEQPVAFLKLLGQVLPRDIAVTGTVDIALSERLEQAIARVRANRHR